MSWIIAQSTPTMGTIGSWQALIMHTQCNMASANSLKAHKHCTEHVVGWVWHALRANARTIPAVHSLYICVHHKSGIYIYIYFPNIHWYAIEIIITYISTKIHSHWYLCSLTPVHLYSHTVSGALRPREIIITSVSNRANTIYIFYNN